MPPELKAQEGIMQRTVELLGFASIALAGTEADDLIACYALAHEGETLIATNDKDILQMVNDRIRIYSTAKADVMDEKLGYALLGTTEVRQKWGVEPPQIGDVLALTGDSSDNIPGVEGVGSKTATALIQQFGNVEALLERTSEIEKPKVREKIVAAAARILQNREMVRLDTHLELPVPVSSLAIQPRYPELIKAMASFEFRTLLAEITRESGITPPASTPATEMKQGDLWG
jgi:DNA polymerase-1